MPLVPPPSSDAVTAETQLDYDSFDVAPDAANSQNHFVPTPIAEQINETHKIIDHLDRSGTAEAELSEFLNTPKRSSDSIDEDSSIFKPLGNFGVDPPSSASVTAPEKVQRKSKLDVFCEVRVPKKLKQLHSNSLAEDTSYEIRKRVAEFQTLNPGHRVAVTFGLRVEVNLKLGIASVILNNTISKIGR